MLAYHLAVGLVLGDCCVQFVPFHVHVSFRYADPLYPPNITRVPFEESYAIDAAYLAVGTVVGESSTQLVPLHSQVLLETVPFEFCPPNRMSCPLDTS